MKMLFQLSLLLLIIPLAGAGAETLLPEYLRGTELVDSNENPVNLSEGRPALFILWSARCPCARKYSNRRTIYRKESFPRSGKESFSKPR